MRPIIILLKNTKKTLLINISCVMCFKLVNSGVSGPRGPPGVCSCNLTTLFAPGNIPELLPGPPGNPGIDGKIGLTGLPVGIIIIITIIHLTSCSRI